MTALRRATPNPLQQFYPLNLDRQYMHDVDGAAEYLVKKLCRLASGEITGREVVPFARRSLDGVRAYIMVETATNG